MMMSNRVLLFYTSIQSCAKQFVIYTVPSERLSIYIVDICINIVFTSLSQCSPFKTYCIVQIFVNENIT